MLTRLRKAAAGRAKGTEASGLSQSAVEVSGFSRPRMSWGLCEGGDMQPFEHVIVSEEDLHQIVGTPTRPRAVLKQRPALDEHCRAFIGRSPFVLVATAGKDGRCDVSPKGDVPGFVRVLDERRLVIPDRPGNKRLDGMRNLLVNPHVGLIFLVPGREETLRVNGRAWITGDPRLLELCVVQERSAAVSAGCRG